MTKTVTKTLVSPITGNLTVYELSSFLQLADGPITFDTAAARNTLTNEYYTQGVDAVCNEVKYIASTTATWVQVDNWVPSAPVLKAGIETLEPVSAIIAAIIIILKIIIPIIVAGIVIAGVAWVVGNIYMAAAYPRIYYTMPDPTTGKPNGPWTREEVLSWNAANYPTLWFDPNTTMGFDPSDPNFQQKKDWVILNTPSGWGQPFGGDILGGLIPIIAIIGGIVIVAIVLPPIIRYATKRGKE